MLYTLLTKNEITAIEEILNSLSIRYEVLVDEELIARQNEEHKYIADRHGQVRRTSALYNLIIEKEEFDKIPDSSQKKLEKFNIFPEMTDIPFQSDTHEIIAPSRHSSPKFARTNRVLSILFLIFFGYMGLMWIDEYIIRIFPASPASQLHKDKRMILRD